MLLIFAKEKFVIRIKSGIKVHTIREDAANRWFVGKKIHFWYGDPRNVKMKNKSYPFGAGCVSAILQIKIVPKYDYVIIDGVVWDSVLMLNHLAVNDGFENWEDMKTFFTDTFEGKIIAWNGCAWK